MVPTAPATSALPTAAHGQDDLKRIRGIGPEIEAALHRIGVRRYAELASWSASDVDKISKTLGLKGRIEHENWIEQAQVLSKGGETAFSRRYDRGEMETAPAPKPQTAASAPAVAPGATAIAEPRPAAAATATQAAGTAAAVAAAAAAAQRAKTTQTDTSQTGAPQTSKPQTPQSVPQSAAPAPAIKPAATATGPLAAVATGRVDPDRVRELTGILAGVKPGHMPIPPPIPVSAPPAAAPAPGTPPKSPAGDDLTRVRGIDRDIAGMLNRQGITRFAQIGAWAPADADRFCSALSLKLGRIQQESWIDQARLLAGMGPAPAPPAARGERALGAGTAATTWHQREPQSAWNPRASEDRDATPAAIAAPVAPPAPTPAAVPAATVAKPIPAAVRPAPAPAPSSNPAPAPAPVPTAHSTTPLVPPRPTLAPASAPAAAEPAPATIGARSLGPGAQDDLKRIKGIGIVLEKKLQSLGVMNYGQIAGWSQAEIDKMSEALDFNGRIERENWIEQARILATGGITDFARRVDRGEVETSKPRPIR